MCYVYKSKILERFENVYLLTCFLFSFLLKLNKSVRVVAIT